MALQVEDAGNFALRNEGGDQQRIDGKSCRAGHQRRDHDGDEAIAPVGDGARCHDAGNGAGKAGQQWNEGAAGQADAAHGAVKQEGRARQIAGIFKRENEEEEDQDLRQKDQHATDAGDDAVDDEAVQQPFGHQFTDPFAEAGDAAINGVHRHFGPTEHSLEHQEQRSGEDQHAPDRM
jgi:hypothetical protein